MFGTAVEQLEIAVEEVLASVRSVEDTALDRGEATEVLLGLERQRERLECGIGSLLSDLEARGAHERDDAYSMANWLAARTGQRRATAGSRVHLARTLRAMPATAAALAAGEITGSHASVLARARNPRTADAFARDEAILVASANKLTADQLVQVVEFWLRHNDPDGPQPASSDRDRFSLSQTLDGRLKGDFDVGGDLAVTIKTAIDEIVSQLLASDNNSREADPTDPRADETTSQRRARALGELCERAAASPANPARRQPLLALHTNINTLAGTGGPEDWLLEIDRPVGWCDAHHILWWELGGHTELDNLVFLCRWHHRWVHAGHLTITTVDGRPRFTNRHGHILVEPRTAPDPPGDPPEAHAA